VLDFQSDHKKRREELENFWERKDKHFKITKNKNTTETAIEHIFN